jgi:hypothetical protein
VGVSGLFMLDYLHPFSVTSGNMVFDLAASSGKDNEFEYNLLTVCRYWNLVKNPSFIKGEIIIRKMAKRKRQKD